MTTTLEPATSGIDTWAKRFFALGDATRLRILTRLAGGERCVCELVGELGAAQSRLSFHLKTLKEAGLVRDERRGRWVYYALEPEGLSALASALDEVVAGEAPWRGESGSGGGCCA